jgi:hypothetical protein
MRRKIIILALGSKVFSATALPDQGKTRYNAPFNRILHEE